MATQYPSGIDSFVNPTSQNTQDAPSHAQQHADANDAIHAIETALGQNPQATATDVAARIAVTETVADAAVPQTRTVAGHALTGDVTLAAADVGARPDDWQPASTDITDATATGRALVTAADAAAVRSVAALPAHPTGHGSPEGLVTASAGTLYTDLDGTLGRWLWTKTTTSGATGWSARTSPVPINPLDLPDLAAAYSNRWPLGIGVDYPTDNTAMANWKDLSGHGRDLVQADTSKQPVWRRGGVNLAENPSFSAVGTDGKLSSWPTYGNASVSLTRVVGGGVFGGDAAQLSVDGVAGDAGAQQTIPPGAPIQGLTVFTVSAWVKAVGGADLAVAIRTNLSSKHVTVPADDEWHRISNAFTQTSPVTFIRPVEFYVGGSASGTILISNVQFEAGSAATPWLPPGNPAGVQFDADDVLTVAAIPGLDTSYLVADGAISQPAEILTADPITVDQTVGSLVSGLYLYSASHDDDLANGVNEWLARYNDIQLGA